MVERNAVQDGETAVSAGGDGAGAPLGGVTLDSAGLDENAFMLADGNSQAAKAKYTGLGC